MRKVNCVHNNNYVGIRNNLEHYLEQLTISFNMFQLLSRCMIVLFYFFGVAVFSGYIHLVNIFNQMYTDGAPRYKYDYIIGENCC